MSIVHRMYGSIDGARATVLLLAMAVLAAGPVSASSPWVGRPLREMIEDLRAQGLGILYSSDLVRDDMRVAVEPQEHEPLARLRETLAPFGLTTRDVSGHRYAIVVAPKRARESPPADHASPTERSVDEILVQGHSSRDINGPAAEPKTDIPRLESPGSLSVISTSQPSGRRNSQTLTEMLAYTAGVTGEEGAANLTDDILVMRGFPVERMFVDGMVRQMSSLNFAAEPYGLERLEVLKGPVSALFGQMTPGGIVNAVTKRPTETPLQEVQAQAGRFDRAQLATDFSGPLDDTGRWLYRVTALGRGSNSSVDFVRNDRRYLAPAVTWRYSDRSSFTLLTSYQRNEASYYNGLPPQGTVRLNPNGIIPARRNPGEPGDSLEAVGKSVSGIFEHRVDDRWSLRQSLRYARFESHSRTTWNLGFEEDLRTLDRIAAAGHTHDDAFTLDNQLLGLFGTRGIEHRLLVGIDYQYLRHDERYRYGAASPLDLFAPIYRREPAGPLTDFYGQADRSMQLGLYVSDQVKISGKWVLLLGGRYDENRHETGDGSRDARVQQESRAATHRLGWVYLADNGLAPYMSFSDSFEPTIGLDENLTPYRPSIGRQYEVGLKYMPDAQPLLLTAAVYDLRRRNAPSPYPQNLDLDIQKGDIRSRGVELEARIELTPQLNLAATYTHTDAIVTRSTDPGEIGTRRGGVPRETATLWITHASGDMHVGFGARYLGRSLGLFDTSLQTRPFTVADVSLGYAFGRWNFALFGNNVFDQRYVEACSYGCFYGPRREIVGSVAYRWESNR